jgi:hypothetical protein
MMATEQIVLDVKWETAVPLLLETYRYGTPAGRRDARDELLRCARIADEAVRLQKALKEPTPEMIEAGNKELDRGAVTYPEDIFTAMVAPLLPSVEPRAD